MPAGHHTCGLDSVWVGNVTVVVACAATLTVCDRLNPATVPETVALTVLDESLRTSALATSVALDRLGVLSVVTTWALRNATPEDRRRVTSRTMPMFLSGGVCTQSIHPIVRFLLGSFGYTLMAMEFVPLWTAEVRSSSWLVYEPAIWELVATWVPLTNTSAADSTPVTST